MITKDISSSEENCDKSMSRLLWRRAERKQWMVAIFFGSAALYASRLILPVSSYYISKELQWDRRSTGIVLGSFFYGYMLTQLLGGYLADKLGGETVLTRVAFVWGLITIVFPHISDLSNNRNYIFYLFILFRGLLGVFQGFHFPSMGSLMAIRVIDTERQFTYCFMSSGAHLGTLLCGSLGSFLMEYYGWRVSFYLIGIMSVFWATLVTRYLLTRFFYNKQFLHSEAGSPPPPPEISPTSNIDKIENKEDEIIVLPTNFQNKIITERQSLPFKRLFSHAAFWAMLYAHFTNSNCVVILISWLPSYFHDNFPDAKGWVFNVVPYVINIPSTLISGLIADHLIKEGYSVTFVRKSMSTIVLLGGGLCLIIMSHVSSYYGALFWMALAICANGFHSSGVLLNPQDLGPEFGGTIYGMMSMVGAIPGFAGVYFVGYLLDVTKSWSLVFQCTGGFCISGWIIYQIWGTGEKIV